MVGEEWVSHLGSASVDQVGAAIAGIGHGMAIPTMEVIPIMVALHTTDTIRP